MNGIPLYFGEIAIQEHFLVENILNECLRIQSLYREHILLGEILVQKGILTAEQVMQILKLQENYRVKLQNEYFVNVVLKKKLLTNQQVWNIRRQHSQDLIDGKNTTFAEIAVNLKIIEEPLVKEIENDEEYQYFLSLKKQGKTSIGGYELIGRVLPLRKAMIYKAIQADLDRIVAVKILNKEFETTENIVEFFNEAKIPSQFNHPNLVRIYDTGFIHDTYYYAMEFIDGINLTEKFSKEGRLQVSDAIKIIRQLCDVLDHLHSNGFIHGQVNPKNIVIREDNVVKLLDLSGSYKIDEPCPIYRMTKMPQYMAPEQIQPNSTFNAATDIYCLGMTFYRMLTGKPGISGKTIDEIKQNILEQEPTPIQELDYTIPEKLAKIVQRMIRKDRSKRYADMKKVLFALKKVL